MTGEHPCRSVSVELPSDIALLELAHCLAKEIPLALGVPDEVADDIGNAALEAVGNAMRHGNNLQTAVPVLICFTADDASITVDVSDRGEGFDPDMLCDPTAAENLLKTCGRGLFLMRAFADSVSVCPRPGGGTTVTLRKAFAA